MKNIIIILTLTVLLIISCVSSPFQTNVDLQTFEDLTIEKITTAIEEEKIALVLEYISTLERKKNADIEELTLYKDEALILINKLFDKAIAENLFLEASRLFLTAQESGLKLSGSWTYNALVVNSVLKENEIHSSTWKSYIIRNCLNLELVDDSEIGKLFPIIVDGGDKSLIKKILLEAEKRSLILPEDNINKYEGITKKDLLRGTVTIWVNRGMKIEGGIGIPDSVIGSGFFIDNKGYLLTNYHVIESEVDPEFEGFSRLYVRLWDDQNTKIPAKVIGWDQVFDIALLKVEIEPSVTFSFSQTSNYEPGSSIIAIGSPGGLENTITSGIISATGRKFLQMGSVIQVDVPINHGNSGGPLIDTEGELAGVVFAGIEQFEGINFAIPGEYISLLLPSLYKGGAINHSFLGAAVQEETQGLRVIYTIPGAGGSRIGLENRDIITQIMDFKTEKIDETNKILLGHEPGTGVRINWIRDGVEMSGIISLDTRPDYPLLDAIKIDRKEILIPPLFGMTVNSISESIFGQEFIITEVFPGSIADLTGLSVNDPFTIKKWEVNEEQKVLIMQIKIKKRKAGFLESGVQLGAYLGVSNFI